MKQKTEKELKDNYEKFIAVIKKYFTGDRLEKLLFMYSEEELGPNLAIAPASEADQKFIAQAWVELPDNLTVGGAINREMQFKLQSAGPVGERA